MDLVFSNCFIRCYGDLVLRRKVKGKGVYIWDKESGKYFVLPFSKSNGYGLALGRVSICGVEMFGFSVERFLDKGVFYLEFIVDDGRLCLWRLKFSSLYILDFVKSLSSLVWSKVGWFLFDSTVSVGGYIKKVEFTVGEPYKPFDVRFLDLLMRRFDERENIFLHKLSYENDSYSTGYTLSFGNAKTVLEFSFCEDDVPIVLEILNDKISLKKKFKLIKLFCDVFISVDGISDK